MIREYIYFVDDNPNGTSGMTEEEIIRCKDCKFYNGTGRCQLHTAIIIGNDEFYCGSAKRKGSEE